MNVGWVCSPDDTAGWLRVGVNGVGTKREGEGDEGSALPITDQALSSASIGVGVAVAVQWCDVTVRAAHDDDHCHGQLWRGVLSYRCL